MLQSFKDFQSEVALSTSQLNKNNETLFCLSKEIGALRLYLGNHTPSHVKHIHHFHKLLWVTVILFIISLLLAYGWVNCYRGR